VDKALVAPGVWKYIAHEVRLPASAAAGAKLADVPESLRRLYRVVDDAQAEGGKALEVRVDKRLIRDGAIPILRTPGLTRAQAPVGLYRVTARLKLSGMLNVIGTAIHFASAPPPGKREPGRYEDPTLHGYQFKQADTWEEFSYLVEVIEPDFLTDRPVRLDPQGALGSFPGTKERWGRLKAGTEPTPTQKWQQERDKFRTDEPRRKQALAAWDKGTLWADLTLLDTPVKGYGRTLNSMQAIAVDWVRIERLAAPATLTVRQVLPQKAWLRPGDEQVFHVWLHNRTGADAKGELRLRVMHGLTSVVQVAAQPVELAAGKYAVVDVPWRPAKGQDLWGCRVVAELAADGAVRSQADEVFSVHENPWAVMNFGGPNRERNPYRQRPYYRNFVESFGVTPGDSVEPWPIDANLPYFTGMSNYLTHVDHQRYLVQHNRTVGVASFMYLCGNGSGLPVQECYQQHPEWFGDRIRWSDQAEDLARDNRKRMLDIWNADGQFDFKQFNDLHLEALPNGWFDEFVRRMTDGIVRNMTYIGYDGVRWDTSGGVNVMSYTRMGVKAGTGETAKDAALSAERMRKLRADVRKVAPQYTEGFNGTPAGLEVGFQRRGEKTPDVDSHPAFRAALEGGGSLMDEGWLGAIIYTDPRNVIKDYFWAARNECDGARRVGGFFHTFTPMRDGTPYFSSSIIYHCLLVMLAGAQYPGPWACTPGSDTGMAQFATRFSEFLWDNKLMWLRDAGKLVRVDCPTELWFDETAVWRDLPDGRRRYVIPIVNPPTFDRFLRDRFGELPEPVKTPFTVEVMLPAGFTGAKAWMLSAEPTTAVVPLKATVGAEAVSFQVPGLTIYRVIVVEFEK
jgi:hypothetical protein